MPNFFALTTKDRQEALAVAAASSGRPIHLLEKDVWVVWTLRELFAGKYGEHLVFKGGTSLSKAYGVIRRFSEDVDLTYDIRAIANDLTNEADSALPPSKSQAKRWTDEIRKRLPKLVSEEIAPSLEKLLREHSLPAKALADGDKILIEYEPLADGYGYVKPSVRLEFGARSTGEPNEVREVVCDAAGHLLGVEFPVATPRSMLPTRTFWEKATAIHVFCHQGDFRGEGRFARHWFDVARLDAAGYAATAIADKQLAQAVAEHKAMFFAEKDKAGNVIDYRQAVNGGLILVPDGEALRALSEDYRAMVDDRLLLDDAQPFDRLIEDCRAIQQRANDAARSRERG